MNRAEEIQTRIANVKQIKGVIVAMRGLAAAHTRSADLHLVAVRAYETTINAAIAQALSQFLPQQEPADGATAHNSLTIIVGAEQGFCGTYNEQIQAAALARDPAAGQQDFILVGQRCISEFPTAHKEPLWSCSMAAQASEVPRQASRIVDALYEQLETGKFKEVCLIYARPAGHRYDLVQRRIVPFDFSRFTQPAGPTMPLVLMPPQDLIESLVEEYVFSEICEAVMLGFAAENQARLEAMTRAGKNVEKTSVDLTRQFQQIRQEETTNEIIELSRPSQ